MYNSLKKSIIKKDCYKSKLILKMISKRTQIIKKNKINNCNRNLLNYRVNMMNNKIKSELTLLNIDI